MVETSGDRNLDVPIWEMGGKGVFVKEVQAAVLDGRADVAVHSAKDLPAVTHRRPGDRGRAARGPTPATRWSARRSTSSAPGAVVATGSVRRRAQLAWVRPDLTFAGLRGQHRHPTAPAPASTAPSSWPPPRSTGSDLADRATEVLDAVGDAAAGRAGRAGGRVPGRRRRHPTSGRPHRRRAQPRHPRGRAGLPGRARRRLRPAGRPRTRRGPMRATRSRSRVWWLRGDGHVVLRRDASYACSGDRESDRRGLVQLGASVARQLLDDDGGCGAARPMSGPCRGRAR